jgi:hypothetical protein
MPLLVPDVGEGRMLKAVVNHTAPENLVLRLYSSNTTPAETDTHTTYTEATFTGYSAATLTGASWSITEGAPSYASYAQQTFTSTSAQATQNIYGYILRQTTSGILMWAERFSDGPYPITNNGDAIRVTPYIELA